MYTKSLNLYCALLFFLAWQEFNETEEIGCFDYNEEYQYSFLNSRDDIYLAPANDLPYVGKYGKYGPGGYYVDLGPKQSLVLQYLNLLEHHKWIDYRTRVVFLDVVIDNTNTRLFSHVKLIFELPTLGGINMVKQVWSANLYPYVYALDYFILLLQLIFIVIWCVRLVFFFIYMLRLRSVAIRAIHTYMRLFEVIFGAAAIIYCILRIHATIAAIASLRQSIGMVYFTNYNFNPF